MIITEIKTYAISYGTHECFYVSNSQSQL